MPGQRLEPGAADHRPRRVGRIGHEAGELAHRVGDVDDVVVDPAGQQREVAELAPAQVVGQLEGPGLDDLDPELLGRGFEGAGVGQARRIGPGEQQHLAASRAPRGTAPWRRRSSTGSGKVWRRAGAQCWARSASSGWRMLKRRRSSRSPSAAADRLDPASGRSSSTARGAARRDGRDRILAVGKPALLEPDARASGAAEDLRLGDRQLRRPRSGAPAAQAEPGIRAAVLVGRIAVAGEIEDRDGAVLRAPPGPRRARARRRRPRASIPPPPKSPFKPPLPLTLSDHRSGSRTGRRRPAPWRWTRRLSASMIERSSERPLAT